MFTQTETKINAIMQVPRQYLSLMSADRQYARLQARTADSTVSSLCLVVISEPEELHIQAFFGR